MRSIHRYSLAAALIAALCAGDAAVAQNQDRGDRDRSQQSRAQQDRAQRDRSQQRQTQRQQDQGSAQLRDRQQQQRDMVAGGGRIVRTKKIEVRGGEDEHLAALVRTQKGNRRIIDLGRVGQYRQAKVRSGDMLFARGNVVNVGPHQVLMARHAEVNGQEIKIRRGQKGRGQVAQGRSRATAGKGTVEGLKKVRVRELGVDHLLVLLRTESGKSRIIDLGPLKNLQQLRMAVGDAISVSGDVVRIGDHEVLMAREIQTGEQRQTVRRDRQQDSRSR